MHDISELVPTGLFCTVAVVMEVYHGLNLCRAVGFGGVFNG